MKTSLRLRTSLSTSEDKSAVKKLLAELSKNLERFEEELGGRRGGKKVLVLTDTFAIHLP